MELVYFITPVLLWGIALIIGSGKANFLIAGYNTASRAKKGKIDEKALSKFMAKFLFVLGFIQLILPVAKIFNISYFDSILILENIIFIFVVIGGIIYMNTGNRFSK
ncbi:DUF3784 domain-containing protein [Clostridium sp. Ade.TY]|uniref:DUF3784 domain-containing protein n=1 Tax=Clostridium sp. Ade.TY TaxID=1391647 RepID=UPI00041AD0D7|nr:DUF3784 domain-containing protein [Clostridium sp. Ade.TY]